MILAFLKSDGICLSCQILHMSSINLLARFSPPNLKILAGMPVLWFFISSDGFSRCCEMDTMASSVMNSFSVVSRFRSSSKCSLHRCCMAVSSFSSVLSMPNEGVSLATKEVLNLHIVLIKPVLVLTFDVVDCLVSYSFC